MGHLLRRDTHDIERRLILDKNNEPAISKTKREGHPRQDWFQEAIADAWKRIHKTETAKRKATVNWNTKTHRKKILQAATNRLI